MDSVWVGVRNVTVLCVENVACDRDGATVDGMGGGFDIIVLRS